MSLSYYYFAYMSVLQLVDSLEFFILSDNVPSSSDYKLMFIPKRN